MSATYYISHEGKQIGPFSMGEIIEKVKANELSQLDYLYDETKEDWVALMEHADVSAAIMESKPKAPPKKNQIKKEEKIDKVNKEVVAEKKGSSFVDDSFMAHDWYILKGENKFGPFPYTDIIKMLQEKIVFEFDFAWHSGLETWTRIAELNAFDPANVRKLQSTLMPNIEEVFFRRRHKRAKYGGTIIVHDNKKVWKGQGVEISAGGAGVVMDNAMLVPGQLIYLHFKPGDGVPPFNAICEVVSKKYIDDIKNKNTPIQYGVKFKSINTNTQKFLKEFTSAAMSA